VTGDEILSLMRLGIFDRNSAADREIMLNLLDQPKETPMTWDGQPEHRNLGGDGDDNPEKAAQFLRDFLGGPRLPPVPPMAADPFSGAFEGAVATHELFRAHREAGFTEQQVLFYLACLIQVGNALKAGGLLPPDPADGA
jgi:hypothetical protein